MAARLSEGRLGLQRRVIYGLDWLPFRVVFQQHTLKRLRTVLFNIVGSSKKKALFQQREFIRLSGSSY